MGTINTTSSGSVFISGTSSGINTSALIDAAVAQRTRRADLIDLQVSSNSTKVSALNELRSLGEGIESALEGLKSVISFSGLDTNLYAARTGVVSSSTGTDPNSLATITIDENAEIDAYDIVIQQRAESLLVNGSNQADATTALGLTGSFELSLTGGAAQQIDITAGQSLNDVANAINAVRADSGVSARVVQVSETDFQLILEADQTNRDIVFNQVAGDNVLNTLGLVDGGDAFQNVLRNFQPGIVSLDGVNAVRDDNLFDDLISGITIDITAADPATTLSLEVQNDVSIVKNAITDFVNAYNDLRDFITQNNQVNEDGTLNEDTILFGDSLLANLDRIVSGIISSASDPTVGALADIGISYDSNNKLVIDDSTLDDLLLNNFDGIRGFFESSYTSSDNQFAIITNGSTSNFNINFDITVDGSGDVTGVVANGDNAAFTFNGTSITGVAGSVYDGLTFGYIGGVNTSLTFDVTQGFADQLFNGLNNFTDIVSGLISEEAENLLEQNLDLNVEAEEIRASAERYREQQIERYGRFEAQLESLKLLQGQLRALFGVEDDN